MNLFLNTLTLLSPHEAIHNPSDLSHLSSSYAQTMQQMDKDWFLRIESEAQESIRQLYDVRKYNQAIQKLDVCPFPDLPNLLKITEDLLIAVSETNNGRHLLRRCCYAIVRKNILNVRTQSIIDLIEKIEKLSDVNPVDFSFNAELDICASILSLIPEDEFLLNKLKESMHPEVLHKKSAKMVTLILQMYASIGVSWKKRWFPYVIKIEEMANRVMTKHEGAPDLKKYIYANYDVDWRVMYVGISNMNHIINSHTSEDIVNTMFWEGMQGGKSPRIYQFADPTPLPSKIVAFQPLLCEKSRYFAAKLLVDSKHNKDEDIAAQSLKMIETFKQIEKNTKILRLYNDFKDESIISSYKSEELTQTDILKRCFCFLSIFPIPLKNLEQMLRIEDVTFDINEYFEIKQDVARLNSEQAKRIQDLIKPAEYPYFRRKLLLLLEKTFHFQPRRITTWKESRMVVLQVENLLKDFVELLSDDLFPIIYKLKNFYETVKSDSDKTQYYQELCLKCEKTIKTKQLAVWMPDVTPYTLEEKDYGPFFQKWKEDHGFISLELSQHLYQKEGESYFEFKVLSKEKETYFIQLLIRNKRIHFNIPENIKHQFEKERLRFEEISLSNSKNKLYETIERLVQRSSFEGYDAFAINEFFENLLIGNQPTLERIILSACYFVSFFDFSFKKQSWGLSTHDDLNEILKRKLCLSYVYHVFGNEYAEETYVAHNKSNSDIIIIPRSITFTKNESINHKIAYFYTSVLTFYEDLQSRKVMAAFKLLYDLFDTYEEIDKKTILYETFLAYQRILMEHHTEWTFSVNRTALYLDLIIKYLLPLQILKIKDLINMSLLKTDYYLGRLNFKNISLLLKNYPKVMNIIYMNYNLVEPDRPHLQNIFSNIKKIIDIIFVNKRTYLIYSNIQSFCKLYVWTKYIGADWPDFSRLINDNLLFKTFNDQRVLASIIRQLSTSSIRFCIFNKRQDPYLLSVLEKLLKRTIDEYYCDTKMLLILERQLIPISPILWATPLADTFLYMFNVFRNKLLHYSSKKSPLKSLVKQINISIRMKENLKIAKRSPEIDELSEFLEKFSIKKIRQLIVDYIIPLWMEAKTELSSNKVRTILDSLNILVKENGTFLDLLEVEYQNFLMANQVEKNKNTLESVYQEFYERFNRTIFHNKLWPRNMMTYRSNGSIFEIRKGYDVLGYILGTKKIISYLRLEDGDNDFLSELITPTFVEESCKITGFGGGGKMKKKVSRHGVPNNALLPLIDADSITHGPFGKSLEAIPFVEGYYYWQRMFNPISQDGDILSGRFRVLFLGDEMVQFKCITNVDGCGFIRESVLGEYASKLKQRMPYSFKKPVQTHQAIHHSKKGENPELFDEAVLELAKNAQKEIDEYLAASQSDLSSVKELFSNITTGGISSGRNFIAVPAAGKQKIIIAMPLKNSDICLGKTPHEKAADTLLKKESEISHLKSEDEQKREDAKFIGDIYGFQYSFIGSDNYSFSFIKGVLIVIPDELWQHSNIDVIFGSKDMKIHSSWVNQKEYPAYGSTITLSGVLTPTQQFGPGSAIAISKDLQIGRWNADYDGDVITVELKPKDTKIFSLLTHTMERSQQYSTPKIPKTFTSAYRPNGSFHMFRFTSIVQARTANLLTDYSKIYDIFTALKKNYQEHITSLIVQMDIVESVIKNILVDETTDNIHEMLQTEPVMVIQKIMSAGIKTGSDCFKSRVDWTYFKKFSDIFFEILDHVGIPTDLAYFKRLCIDMYREYVDFEDVILQAEYQSQFFDSIPLHVLYKTLSTFPKYKLSRLSQLLVKQGEQDHDIRLSIEHAKKLRKHREREANIQKKLDEITNKNIQKLIDEDIFKQDIPILDQKIKTSPDEPILSIEKEVEKTLQPSSSLFEIPLIKEKTFRPIANATSSLSSMIIRCINLFSLLDIPESLEEKKDMQEKKKEKEQNEEIQERIDKVTLKIPLPALENNLSPLVNPLKRKDEIKTNRLTPAKMLLLSTKKSVKALSCPKLEIPKIEKKKLVVEKKSVNIPPPLLKKNKEKSSSKLLVRLPIDSLKKQRKKVSISAFKDSEPFMFDPQYIEMNARYFKKPEKILTVKDVFMTEESKKYPPQKDVPILRNPVELNSILVDINKSALNIEKMKIKSHTSIRSLIKFLK